MFILIHYANLSLDSDPNRLKVKVWKKYHMQTVNKKKTRVAVLISDNTDLKLESLLETKNILQ